MNKTPSREDEARLKALTAEATLKYSIHDYDAAAELYSQATELQADLNGEMSSLNADLLYQYGRCLYHVAVRKSDVLGSKVAGEKSEEGSFQLGGTQQLKRKPTENTGDGTKIAKGGSLTSTEDTDASKKVENNPQQADKPYFQFTGDENFEDSEEDYNDVDGRGGDEDAQDEEDDFVNAYEVLDLARILLLRRIEEAQESDGGGQDLRHVKERLADAYDLQAEISLEGERFPLAVVDLKAALALKQALFPRQSSLIAEAHYKLSLALEFSSVTEQKSSNGDAEAGTQATVDEEMREAAALEMEAAIESCNLRIKEEEAKFDAASWDEGNVKLESARRNIEDVKEMVNDMEQRLIELRLPPFSIDERLGKGTNEGMHPLKGILGSILKDSPAVQKTKLEAASIGAADLTNLVKRKNATATRQLGPEIESIQLESNGKRKVGFVEEVVDVGTGKKAKLSDANNE